MQAAKRPRTDVQSDVVSSSSEVSPAPGVSGAGSGGEAAGGGHPGGYSSVVHGFSNHHAIPYTITSGGTTWLNTTDAGEVGTDWALFPWEFPSLFMSNNECVELFNNYMFWRCKSVSITFKNFKGFVNNISASETIPNTFPTDNPGFMTYIDDMYFMGLQVAPFANEAGWADEATIVALLQSWQKGGYNGANRVSLPIFDIAVNNQIENVICQNYPNVSQTQAVAGETVHKQWATHGDKYWRDTSEFIWGMPLRDIGPASGPQFAFAWAGAVVRPFRVDQMGGFILSGGNAYGYNDPVLEARIPPSVLPNSSVFNSPYPLFTAESVERALAIQAYGKFRGATGDLTLPPGIPPVVYTTPEPIPPLLLRIVPQHIEGNGNSTHIQFDFEINYHIEVRCKIPRHGYTNFDDLSKGKGFAQPTGGIITKGRPGTGTPVMMHYPSVVDSTTYLSNGVPVTGPEFQGIQRGRTKNGFVFIPYSGWENGLRVINPASTRSTEASAPPVSETRESIPRTMSVDTEQPGKEEGSSGDNREPINWEVINCKAAYRKSKSSKRRDGVEGSRQ